MNKLEKIKEILEQEITMDLSVYDLCLLYRGYRRTKRGKEVKVSRRITKKMKIAILELAKIKHEDNKKLSQTIVNSNSFKLACALAEKRKKLKKVYISDNNWRYEGNIEDIILYMREILVKANQGINKQNYLKWYCEGKDND
jgi:hypothetical protein